jgi:hypothetical protein
MPPSGHRYRLVLYTHMLNRWWKALLALGMAMLGLVAALLWLPVTYPQYPIVKIADWILLIAGSAGVFAVLAAVFLICIRKSAYIQPFPTHIRLATPFLRMNISYRRIRQSSTAEMGRLFPLKKKKSLRNVILRPLLNMTAIELDLIGWPLPRSALALFLSPYFFPDKSSRLALLVPDWMAFSNEMESFRSSWQDTLRPAEKDPRMTLLANINRSRR